MILRRKLKNIAFTKKILKIYVLINENFIAYDFKWNKEMLLKIKITLHDMLIT